MKAEKAWKAKVCEKCLREIAERAKNKVLSERMETICTVLKDNFPYYFWVGFYIPKEDLLELGPSTGPPACAQIPFTGVCGKAAESRRPIVVPDVTRFPGHVTCDPRSRSEIALPVFDRAGVVIAVFDVDSKDLASFDETDQEWLEQILGAAFLSPA